MGGAHVSCSSDSYVSYDGTASYLLTIVDSRFIRITGVCNELAVKTPTVEASVMVTPTQPHPHILLTFHDP